MSKRKSEGGTAKGRTRIVSSAHLAAGKSGEMSEFEFGLIVAFNAFSRWSVRCMAAAGEGLAGVGDMGPLDVLVLHSVNHKNRDKKLSDICLVLNIEDTHLVTYALKKLVKLGLVSGTRQGKESAYKVTPAGADLCVRYREVREDCLLDTLDALGLDAGDITHMAGMLRALSGLYDQAARSAAVL